MTLHRIKHAALAAFSALALLGSAHAQTVNSLSDLNTWGSGSNRAGLVISWHDGKSNSTLAWGFSWSGSKTVWDMLTSLAATDPRLFARIDSATQYGPALFGLGYDENGNGIFSVTGAHDVNGQTTTPVFLSGISDMNTSASTTEAPGFDSPSDPSTAVASANASPGEIADHYAEGWLDNGYWELFTGDTGSSYPVTWTSSFDGAGNITLANNGWYAFSIAGEYDPNLGSSPSYPPGTATVAPVPEPATVILLAIGGLALLVRRRFRHAQ
jgi:hypothetical protein